MKIRRRKERNRMGMIILASLALSGCQGGLTSLPSLNHPSRIPPPSSGSFQIPPNYADPAGGGASVKTTLSQLRAIESGQPSGSKITPDGMVTSSVTNGSFQSRPFVAPVASTLESATGQLDRSLEAATAVFLSDVDANGNMPLGKTNLQAASATSLNEASPIDSEVNWKSPQRQLDGEL